VVIGWSKYCHRVLDVDAKNRTCTVEPGIVLDVLNERLKADGLRFGPEPATHMNCTKPGCPSAARTATRPSRPARSARRARRRRRARTPSGPGLDIRFAHALPASPFDHPNAWKQCVVNETVVITGASAGIGRATAVQFGRRGANVALIARGDAGLNAAALDVTKAGGTALPLKADVADFQAVDAAAEAAQREFGSIDIWVNVAFTSVFAPFTQIKPEEFRRVTEVSYLGFVHGTMAALARMKPRDRGTIVQVGSALGYRSIPLQSAYCGAKHAVNGFTESVRCELLHEGSRVRITVVQMPAVNTPQFSWVLSRLPRHPQPVPPIYQPEVAARAVLLAADHPGHKEHWAGASTVGTILAQKVGAPLLDRYLARTGYGSQQTGDRTSGRPANLWEPADQPPGKDYGAHGEFDERSKPRSAQLRATEAVARASEGVARASEGVTRATGSAARAARRALAAVRGGRNT
jgi:NAD(P)-dependent dehydrogenase (short-subunit alcohol dehydrogenase family)